MNLVLTITIGNNYKKLAELTHPTIKAYADKIGADFYCITERKVSNTTYTWEKFQIYDLLDKYDRILYVDTDLIIRPNTPDIFKMVPEDCLGMFENGKYINVIRAFGFLELCAKYETQIDWNWRYYNAGVMVISKIHQPIFIKPEVEINHILTDQNYINMIIARDKIDVCDIGYKFNHTVNLYTLPDTKNSYIIHYAQKNKKGNVPFDIIVSRMKKDLNQ